MTISQSEKAKLPRVGRVFILAHKAKIIDAVMRGETLRSIYDNFSPAAPVSYSRFAGLVHRWCGDPVGQLRSTAVKEPRSAATKPASTRSEMVPEIPTGSIFTPPTNRPKVVEFNPDDIDLTKFK